MCHLPEGRRRLPAAWFRAHTSLDLEPAEIHAIGLAEIARIDARVRGARRPRARRRPDLMDAGPPARRPGALLRRPRRGLRRRGRVPRPGGGGRSRLVRTAAAGGRATSSRMAAPRGGALDDRATTASRRSDGSRPGQYYINTSDPRRGRATRPRRSPSTSRSPATTSRSRSPRSCPTCRTFRRNLGTTAFVEGWGLYTERLRDEMGLYSATSTGSGSLSFDAWRACRLVVDTGMHAMGWSRDAGDRVHARAHGPRPPNNIENEVDRYIVWPGPGPRLQARPARDPRLRDEARGAARRPVRHPRASTTPSWAAARCPADAAGRRRGLGPGRLAEG